MAIHKTFPSQIVTVSPMTQVFSLIHWYVWYISYLKQILVLAYWNEIFRMGE